MAKPKKTGRNSWSIRVRSDRCDEYLSGYLTASAASKAAAEFVSSIRRRGRPVGLGPGATTLAQALSDWALQTLEYQKSAPQTVRRLNKYLRFAHLPELVLAPAARDDSAEAPKPKAGRKKKDSPKTCWFEVRLQTAEEQHRGREVVNSLRGHRERQSRATRQSDKVRQKLACRSVAEITRDDIQTLINAMRAENAGLGTMQQEQALLRAFFFYADEVWNWSEPARNPASGLRMPGGDNCRDRVMTEEEEVRLLRALGQSRNPEAVLIIQLLVETAMRCGEPLEHAHWGGVDWERCVLRLDDGVNAGQDPTLFAGEVAVLPGGRCRRVAAVGWSGL